MIKKNSMQILNIMILFCFFSIAKAQYDFELQDLNPHSVTFGQSIGPNDYLGDICIIFFGHEY